MPQLELRLPPLPPPVPDSPTTQEARCKGTDGIACFDLALRFARGDGVAKEPARAAALYERACELHYQGGCNNLGVQLVRGEGMTRDHRRAAELYARACEGGYAMSCGNLASLYKLGVGVPRDRKRAAELYDKACASGDPRSCEDARRLAAAKKTRGTNASVR